MSLNLQANKEKFIQIFKGEITREGADAMLDWLENSSDFFTAPYTGQYVLSCEGGACQHALDTFKAFSEMVAKYREQDPFILCDPDMLDTPENQQKAIAEVDQSVAIASLLSGVGIANSWVKGIRNVQKPDGKWEKVPCYKWEEEFIYGGVGGKSVFIIQQFMRLYVEEAQAIRFHKQGKEIPYGNNFEDSFYGVYETNLFASMLGVAHNEAHNVSDKLIWEKIKPQV
ncbi:MAG: hypothetical protein NC218_01460 [Acetobacter sp.]|nr:hypothetical protein [Acetobacter sp.]